MCQYFRGNCYFVIRIDYLKYQYVSSRPHGIMSHRIFTIVKITNCRTPKQCVWDSHLCVNFELTYLTVSAKNQIFIVAFGTQVRGFKPGRSRRIFWAKKILSTPSFRGEVKPSAPCRALQNVKEPKSDVEVVTFGKILGHFSPLVPPSDAGFAIVTSDIGGLLWRKLECSKSLVLLRVGGLTCTWQRHSVKPSCWECSTIVEQAKTQLRVVVPTEEEIVAFTEYLKS
jgi:hypothetical protein